MGTEESVIVTFHRNKPPPVPPRPQHLIPVKTISKYSSMPDILTGWKRDPNPDLLRLPNPVSFRKGSTLDMIRFHPVDCPVTVANGASEIVTERPLKNRMKCLYETTSTSKGEKNANTKSSKKFSCIPGRSNSKKKKHSSDNISSNGWLGKTNNRADASQSSWYVEDIGETMVQSSKCKITVNSDRNYRYSIEKPTSESTKTTTLVVCDSGTDSLQRSSYTQPQSQSTTMSSVLSGLPPLPKSLSDASMMWDSSSKKLLSGPVNLLPSSSSASSSSRNSSCVHPKVPPPVVPRLNSVVSDEQALPTAFQSKGGPLPREEKPPPPPPPRKPTSLDMKLSLLRKEMHTLRQMDLSLLSQLWSLNEAIHEFRQMQDTLSPASVSLHSSDEEDSGCYHSNVSSQGGIAPNQQSTLRSTSSTSSVSTSRSTICDKVKL